MAAGVPGPLAQGHNLQAADGWRAVEPQRLGSGWGHHSSAWYMDLLSDILLGIVGMGEEEMMVKITIP